MGPGQPSPTAAALQAVRDERWGLAESIIGSLIEEVFAMRVASVSIARDRYSLNSVNGFVQIADGQDYFFKFHHEAGEEVTLEEFYRGEILQEAGFPVDAPAFVSRTIGRQMLLYRRRTSQRLADLCDQLDGERRDRDPLDSAQPILDAQASLDALTATIYLRTLHVATAAQIAGEPIHQLFHHRLHDPSAPDRIGARARRFFWEGDFDIAGTLLSAAQLRAALWTVNGISYRDSIDALLTRSQRLLEPRGLARFGAVTAHGDAHNANVWWDESDGGPRMVFYDPAFAGEHVCALLAEVKATFHNIFAHPLWLYHADRASRRYRAAALHRSDDRIDIETDWTLSPLRERFLASKSAQLWRPLLARMNDRGLLADDWRATLRCALFCCPALVMDLRAGGSGGHTPISSAIGLATAVAVGSEPVAGQADTVSRFLDSIDPLRPPAATQSR